MKSSVIIFVFMFAAQALCADHKTPVGFINLSGKTIIEAAFSEGREFKEGLCAVRVDTKWGFIQASGSYLVKPRFDNAFSFNEGLARVKLGSKYGYISHSGEFLIKPTYSRASDFSEGSALVFTKGSYRFIDRFGTDLFTNSYKDALPFSEGLAGVVNKSGNYIINRKGLVVGKTPTELDFPFRNGLSAVYEMANNRTFLRLIDHRGLKFGPKRLSYVRPCTDGLLAAYQYSDANQQKRWGYLKKSGEFAFYAKGSKFNVDRLHGPHSQGFSEGLAAMRKGKCFGYVNHDGKFVIEPVYISAEPFSEGLAVVEDTSGCYYIDRFGKQQFDRKFVVAASFSEGLAAVHFRSKRESKINDYLKIMKTRQKTSGPFKQRSLNR